MEGVKLERFLLVYPEEISELRGNLSRLQKSEFLKLIMLIFIPSITDGVHRNKNFVEIIPVFSTFGNFFQKKK